MTANKNETNSGESIGQRFLSTREALGVTPSEVAAATNMLEKHVKAMENDDFASMGAAIYTKGFIKLYAEYLGLPPQPFVDEYARKYSRSKTGPQPGLNTAAPKPPRPSRPPKKDPEVAKKMQQGVSKAVGTIKRIPKPVLKMWLINGAAALVLILLVAGLFFGIRGCVSSMKTRTASDDGLIVSESREAIIEEPPDPYINSQL